MRRCILLKNKFDVSGIWSNVEVMLRKITSYTTKKASEHIYYEVLMFFQTLEILMNTRDQMTINISLDAFSIHCRNIFDFLYPKNNYKPDDILVTDYIIDRKGYNKNKVKKMDLKFIVKKADKQVAHLTYSRNKFGIKRKPWYFVEIGRKIHKSLVSFYNAMSLDYKKIPNFISLKKVLDRFDRL